MYHNGFFFRSNIYFLAEGPQSTEIITGITVFLL